MKYFQVATPLVDSRGADEGPAEMEFLRFFR